MCSIKTWSSAIRHIKSKGENGKYSTGAAAFQNMQEWCHLFLQNPVQIYSCLSRTAAERICGDFLHSIFQDVRVCTLHQNPANRSVQSCPPGVRLLPLPEDTGRPVLDHRSAPSSCAVTAEASRHASNTLKESSAKIKLTSGPPACISSKKRAVCEFCFCFVLFVLS